MRPPRPRRSRPERAHVSTALAYHAATKYHPSSIGQLAQIYPSRQPLPYKDYACAEPIELAQHLPLDPNPFTGESADPELADSPAEGLGLGAISRWLYFTYGVTGFAQAEPHPLYLRAAPSAGGLYPGECYVIARAGAVELELEPGLYGYYPLKHQLVPLWPGEGVAAALDLACYGDAAVAAAPLALVVSGVFQRSAWRYQERAYRRVLLDSGHLLGNAGLAATTLRLRTHLTSAFCDQRLNQLLRVDEAEEGALAVCALNLPGKLERPAWSALPSVIPSGDGAAGTPPLMPKLHAAGKLPEERPRMMARGEAQGDELEANYAYAGGEALDLGEAEGSPLAGRVFETILARRSTRAYDARPFSRAQLARILAAAYAPEHIELGEQPGLARALLMTFVAVADIDGLDAGVYYFAPHARHLRLLRPGCDRRVVQHLCLGQELGRDAAATVFHTADLPRAVAHFGDRAYRYLHLDAGMLGQRLNLAALAEGLGASGIGGFYDDEVNGLLGIPDRQAVIYVTTLGVPASG